MRIGLIDVDGHNYPNIPLMKISAWHKENGDNVSWHEENSGKYDRVYMSKVFSFSKDYDSVVNADEVIKGGSGYCIRTENGKEIFDKSRDAELPYYIEHIYPDYELYGDLTKDTAYGFMSRGCPRGCEFCHVACKEGRKSVKVADLNEFWRGQKNIQICDPNTLACNDWRDIFNQLSDSKSCVDFNQGLDIRLLGEEQTEYLSNIKMKHVHFAYDTMKDKELIEKNFLNMTDRLGYQFNRNKAIAYVLVNFNTTIEEDLHRVYFLREIGIRPYVMVYNKESLPRSNQYSKLTQWTNNPIMFWVCDSVEDFIKKDKERRMRYKNGRCERID